MNTLEELYHLGDNCAPGIIINDILKCKIKKLFMLGGYSFNDILFYLKDGNYEKIYNEENLIIQEDKSIKHSLYNFVFNHDYNVINSKITNYNFIKDRFNIKIKNFKDMLLTEKTCVFITFNTNVDNLKINEMIDWFSHNKKNFYLIIFTDKEYNNSNIEYSNKYSVIKLKNSCDGWFAQERKQKIILYNEVYNEFIKCLEKNNIKHDYPLTITQEHIP